MRLPRFITSAFEVPTVHAHCDLPCGVYDPAQARIEAESVKAICEKVADNDDADFRVRATIIKDSVPSSSNHLWVLWTDSLAHFEVPEPAHSCSTRPPSRRCLRDQGQPLRRQG